MRICLIVIVVCLGFRVDESLAGKILGEFWVVVGAGESWGWIWSKSWRWAEMALEG